jgi:predicted RNase H-like nuclease (RuvC/YqgF family)
MTEVIFGGGRQICEKCGRTIFGSALCGCDTTVKRQTKIETVEQPETTLDDFDMFAEKGESTISLLEKIKNLKIENSNLKKQNKELKEENENLKNALSWNY